MRIPARLALPLLAAVFSLLWSAEASAWELVPGTPAELDRLHDELHASLHAFPRHGAKPLGLAGFELFVEGAFDTELDGSAAAAPVVEGSLPADVLLPLRVGVRKGLPGGLDLGLSYGRVLDWSFESWTAEAQFRLLGGGVVAPSLGLRATYSVGESDHYDLDQIGVEVIASKAFTLLALYGGVGLVRGEGSFRFPGEPALDPEDTTEVAFVGVRLNLLVPKITVSVEKTERWQAGVRVSFGI